MNDLDRQFDNPNSTQSGHVHDTTTSSQHCSNCQMVLPAGARFCLNCGRPVSERTPTDEAHLIHLAAAAPPPLVEKVHAAATLTGERRQVTALFVDVVGSTALSQQVGPAGWSTIMNIMRDWFCPVIYRYEGTIARFVGDELLAFFGAPVAHEDDPVRAVHAALEILDIVAQRAVDKGQEPAVDFGVRISLSTGPVTIGPVSSDLQFEYSALEGTLNLAAQLEATKQPMAVLVSQDTYRLIAPFFDCVNLGQVGGKSQTETIHIYQVTGVKTDLKQVQGLAGLESPMVGRDSELETLLQLTETVAAGLGRVALIVSESGLGKTRLIAEWKTAVTQLTLQPPLQWAEGRCLSYGQGQSYHLLRDLLHSLIDVPATAGEPENRAALYSLTRQLFGDSALEVYPYLGHLLSLALKEEALARVQSLDPPALQAQYLVAFRRLLTALAARGPLVLILEDLHWADPSSVDILSKLLPLAAAAPLLFCLVTRPHPETAGWKLVTTGREILGGRFSEWTLNHLAETDSRQLVSNLLQIETLPERLQRLILKKAEGNPCFVEEVLRMMVDRGAIRRQNGGWAAGAEIKTIGIPDTLQGVLLARLDRLSDEAKRTLRVAAVIGRRFPVRVLEQVLSNGEDSMALITHLGVLESSGLIDVCQVKPELMYRFRHTLLHDTAYTSLLTADRQRLHLAVGEAMERLYPHELEHIAPQLAHHFSVAGDTQCALTYLSMAGDTALNGCANQEAESRYRMALDLDPTPSKQADLLFKLGQALYWQSRFQDAIQVWRRGIGLYQVLGDSEGVALSYARSVRALWDGGDTPGGLKLCQEGLSAVANAPQSPGLALLMHEAARAYLFNGLPDEARPLCRRALEMAEHLGDITVQSEALATLGLLPGQPPEESLASLYKAAELAESAGLYSQSARAHVNLASLMTSRMPDFPAACEHYRRAAEFQRLRGNIAGELLGLGGMASVLLEAGNLEEAETTLLDMRQYLDELTNPGPAVFHMRINEALLRRYRGELSEAAGLLRTLQSEERSRGNYQNLVDVDYYLAEVILASYLLPDQANVGEWEEAHAAMAEAIEIHNRWPSGGVRTRCLLSMIHSSQGELAGAHHLLSEARQGLGSQSRAPDEGWVSLAGARLAAAESLWPHALSAYESAAGAFARLGMGWWQARILQEWAEAHISRGEPTDLEQARTLFQEASSMFAEMGAHTYTNLVESKLQALEVKSYAQALAHQQVTQEMVAAGKIQSGILPANPPHARGWQLTAALEPSRQTSGDFYDFIPLSDGRLGIVIADVADKGAAAALFMALSSSLIRTYAVEYANQPDLVLGETNRRILSDTHTDLFVTVFYAVLDPSSGTLLYSNAGHNPPYHFQAVTGAMQPLTRTGMPVGLFADSTWGIKTAQISPGDVLLLYTDGVIDVQDRQEGFFDAQRLITTVQSNLNRSAQEIQAAILTAINQFAGGVPQFDDITLVTLARESQQQE